MMITCTFCSRKLYFRTAGTA